MNTPRNRDRWSFWTIVCLLLLGLSAAGVAFFLFSSPPQSYWASLLVTFISLAPLFAVVAGVGGLVSALLGRSRQLSGFLAFLGLFLAVPLALMPHFKAEKSARRGSCINKLRMIDAAKDEYALHCGGTNGTTFTWDDLALYINDMSNKVFCPSATPAMRSMSNYTINVLGVNPECKVVGTKGGHTLQTD